MIRRLVLLLLSISTLVAAEIPAKVLSVTDGDTCVVEIQGAKTRVRLLYIDTPETRNNTHGLAMLEGGYASEFTKNLLPVGTLVKLLGPGTELERDRYGRILALILLPNGSTAQERIISAGFSPYWRKYGEAPIPWHNHLLNSHASAKAARAGLWTSQPKWMQDKTNERTAPRIQSKKLFVFPTAGVSISPNPTKNEAVTDSFWLNTSSGVRHNSKCKNYKMTARGRNCTAAEGRPCGMCGG